jgi:hypothetical protein
MARGNRDRYEYVPSYEDTVDRAERKGMFNGMIKGVKSYTAKQGDNWLRILPPLDPKQRHYGIRVKVHFGVGANNQRFLCLNQSGSPYEGECPSCAELARLGARATKEDRSALKAGEQVLYYVIDRDHEKEGPQAWFQSGKTDGEIAAQSVNKRNKSLLNITHVDHGYDLEFIRSGTGRDNTEYRGFKLMHESSPLCDDERLQDDWLDFIEEHPLSSILVFVTPEEFEREFYGRVKRRDDRDDRDGGDDRLERRSRDRDDDRDKSDDDGDNSPRDRRSGRDRTDRDEEPVRERNRERPRERERDDRQPSSRERPSSGRERFDDDQPSSERRSANGRDRDEPRGSRGDEVDSSSRRSRDSDRGRDRDSDDADSRSRSGRDRDRGSDDSRRGRERTALERDLDDEIPSEDDRGSRGSRSSERGRSRDEEPEDRGSSRRGDDDGRRSRLRDRVNRDRD